jgi:hypothetical protein
LWISSTSNFPHPVVTSSFLGSNIPLETFSSSTPSRLLRFVISVLLIVRTEDVTLSLNERHAMVKRSLIHSTFSQKMAVSNLLGCPGGPHSPSVCNGTGKYHLSCRQSESCRQACQFICWTTADYILILWVYAVCLCYR